MLLLSLQHSPVVQARAVVGTFISSHLPSYFYYSCMWLLIFVTTILLEPVLSALDTAAVIAIQNELNKHSAELEMLLDVCLYCKYSIVLL